MFNTQKIVSVASFIRYTFCSSYNSVTATVSVFKIIIYYLLLYKIIYFVIFYLYYFIIIYYYYYVSLQNCIL